MLRFVNHKLDWFLDHSRRLLPNLNTSVTQNYHRCQHGIANQNVALSVAPRYEETSLTPSHTCKEADIKWQICHVKHYEDLHNRHLMRLRHLYEALNHLSISDDPCEEELQYAGEIHEHVADLSCDRIIKTYNLDDIIRSLDKDFEFNGTAACLPAIAQQYLQEDIYYEKSIHFLPDVTCRNGLTFPLHPANPHGFPPQAFSILENLSEQLMCSKFSEPTNSGGGDEKENKGPSQGQLDLMQEYLVENFPKFLSDKVDYSVYTNDVEFVINWYPEKSYSTKGTVNYAIEVARLRLFVHLRLARVKMTLMKVTNHTDDGSIKVRWRIVGVPHSKALWRYFSDNDTQGASADSEWLDGFSTFYLNNEGLVKKHILDRIIPETEKDVKRKPSMMEKLGLKIRLPLPT